MNVIKIHNFIFSSGSGTVINYGSGSDFLTSYGCGSTSKKVTVPSYGSGSTTLVHTVKGSGSVPLTNGFGRSKSLWIRKVLRIRDVYPGS